jgi:hypothetical protein
MRRTRQAFAAENFPSGGRYMSLRNLLRKVFLCIALGGHSVFAVGMSQEKIEELLHAMHQTRIEVTISDDDEANHASGPLDSRLLSNPAKQLPVKDGSN